MYSARGGLTPGKLVFYFRPATEKHPDKTFIRHIAKGVDFLGYPVRTGSMTIALKTIEQFVARVCRLYKQSQAEPLDSSRLGDYVRQWVRWFKARLPGVRQPQRRLESCAKTELTRDNFQYVSMIKFFLIAI